MPAKVQKKGKCYTVKTPNMTHAKCTTKKKAKSQQKLLNAIEHGYVPHKMR